MVQQGLPGIDVPDLIELTQKNVVSIDGEYRDEDDQQSYDDLWEALAYRNTSLSFSSNHTGAVDWLTLEFKDVDRPPFCASMRLTLSFTRMAAMLPEDLAAQYSEAAKIVGASMYGFRLNPILRTNLTGRLPNGVEKEYTDFRNVEKDRRLLEGLTLTASDKQGLVTVVFRSLDVFAGTFEFVVTGDARKLAQAARANLKERAEVGIRTAEADIKREQERIESLRAALAALEATK